MYKKIILALAVQAMAFSIHARGGNDSGGGLTNEGGGIGPLTLLDLKKIGGSDAGGGGDLIGGSDSGEGGGLSMNGNGASGGGA